MGSFRSKASIDAALGTLVPRAEVEALLSTPREDRPHPQASDVLQPGEWIKYRLVLPLKVANAISDAAARPIFDDQGNFQSMSVGAGAAGQTKLEGGIVDGALLDENGTEVRWDARKPSMLVEGMEEGLRRELMQVIGEDDEPDVSAKSPDDPESTVGEGSGGISDST